MEFALRPKREAWRGRGRARRMIPPEIKDMADRTYRTGNIGSVTIGPDDEEDAAELVKLLQSYARSLGRWVSVQRDDDELRFEMRDRKPRKKVSA